MNAFDMTPEARAAKEKQIAERQLRSWSAPYAGDKLEQAAREYAWMQCERDGWKDLYLETLRELNRAQRH